MSATPLPAVSAPAPTPSGSAPQPANAQAQSNGTSFNTHLQSAKNQQQQASSDAAQGSDDGQDDGGDSGTNAQPTGTSSSSGAPGSNLVSANTNAQNQANGSSVADASAGTGTNTLASAVLSLIDQSSGTTPTDGASAKTANGATAKPATQPNTKQTATTHPNAAAAGMVTMPLPVVASTTTASSSGGDSTNVAQVKGATTNGKDSQSASLATQGDSGSANTNASTGSTDATTASAGTATDAGSASQGASTAVQALAGSIASLAHAGASPSNSSSQSTSDIAALGNLTATAPSTPATAAATHNLATDAPVGSSGFAKELGQQITWLSGQDVKQAQIRLNPQDLGPLDVKVSVDHGRVDVTFMTQHPATTAAVQQSLDQLSHMLGGQGLSLGHASVGQHAQQQAGAQQGQPSQSQSASDDIAEAVESHLPTAARVALGLVDAFA